MTAHPSAGGPAATTSAARDRWLIRAGLLFAAGLVLHTADHARRGIAVLPEPLRIVGAVSTVLGILVLVLVLRRHRWAPLAAAIYGAQTVLGVTRAHLLPGTGPFSDPFPGAAGTGVTPFSWVVVGLEVAGALALCVAGFALLLRNRAEAGASTR